MRKKRKEYKGKVFRLSGREGCDFDKLKVAGVEWKGNKNDINFYVEVVGFEDLKSKKRNWGRKTFKFYERLGVFKKLLKSFKL